MYAHGFRFYFTPLPGFFSPFPHGTCSLSVIEEYLGLSDGPDRFKRDFSGPVLLGIPSESSQRFDYGGITLCADLSHGLRLRCEFLTLCLFARTDWWVPRPRTCNDWRLSRTYGLASSAFARHYSRNRDCFLFLSVLRCFTSRRSLRTPYIFRRG